MVVVSFGPCQNSVNLDVFVVVVDFDAVVVAAVVAADAVAAAVEDSAFSGGDPGVLELEEGSGVFGY